MLSSRFLSGNFKIKFLFFSILFSLSFFNFSFFSLFFSLFSFSFPSASSYFFPISLITPPSAQLAREATLPFDLLRRNPILHDPAALDPQTNAEAES